MQSNVTFADKAKETIEKANVLRPSAIARQMVEAAQKKRLKRIEDRAVADDAGRQWVKNVGPVGHPKWVPSVEPGQPSRRAQRRRAAASLSREYRRSVRAARPAQWAAEKAQDAREAQERALASDAITPAMRRNILNTIGHGIGD